MKKLLITIVCVMLGAAAVAQTEHLKFKGVPIDGTLEEYTAAIKQKGAKDLNNSNFQHFSHSSINLDMMEDKNIKIFVLDFAGYPNCNVVVRRLDNRNLIYKIEVFFQSKCPIGCMKDIYANLKNMLTQKYGKPKSSNEVIGTNLGDDYFTYEGFINGTNIYNSLFETNAGSIFIEIINERGVTVKATYTDYKNSKVVNKDILDDL